MFYCYDGKCIFTWIFLLHFFLRFVWLGFSSYDFYFYFRNILFCNVHVSTSAHMILSYMHYLVLNTSLVQIWFGWTIQYYYKTSCPFQSFITTCSLQLLASKKFIESLWLSTNQYFPPKKPMLRTIAMFHLSLTLGKRIIQPRAKYDALIKKYTHS